MRRSTKTPAVKMVDDSGDEYEPSSSSSSSDSDEENNFLRVDDPEDEELADDLDAAFRPEPNDELGEDIDDEPDKDMDDLEVAPMDIDLSTKILQIDLEDQHHPIVSWVDRRSFYSSRPISPFNGAPSKATSSKPSSRSKLPSRSKLASARSSRKKASTKRAQPSGSSKRARSPSPLRNAQIQNPDDGDDVQQHNEDADWDENEKDEPESVHREVEIKSKKRKAVATVLEDQEELEPLPFGMQSSDLVRAKKIPLLEEIAPVRRSLARKGKGGYKTAFELLRDGNVEGFLSSWIIQRLFEPIHVLVTTFGQGHRASALLNLWTHHWNGRLLIRRLTTFRLKARCCGCNLQRMLRYCLYLRPDEHQDDWFTGLDDQNDGDLTLLGVMGCDCFTIKFVRMMEVVDSCYLLLSHIDERGFDAIVLNFLSRPLDRVREAPAVMAKRYSKKNLDLDLANFNDDDDE